MGRVTRSNSTGGTESAAIPRTRGQLENERKRKLDEEEEQRRHDLFTSKKKRGVNDIVVDQNAAIIKLEAPVDLKNDEVEGAAADEPPCLLKEAMVERGTEASGMGEVPDQHEVPAPVLDAETIENVTHQEEETVKLRNETEMIRKELEEQRLQMQKLQEQFDSYSNESSRSASLEGVIGGTAVVGNLQQSLNNETPDIIYFEKVLPYIMTYLNLDTLLTCRLTCSQWRNQIDSHFENHFSRRSFSSKDHKVELQRKLKGSNHDKASELLNQLDRVYTFSNTHSIAKLLQKQKISRGNPFIGRSVSFQIDSNSMNVEFEVNSIWSTVRNTAEWSNNLNELLCKRLEPFTLVYWQFVEELLSLFGRHIWYVTIKQNGLGLTPNRLWEIVQTCLPHLPNLKRLTIAGATEPLLQNPRQPRRKSTDDWKIWDHEEFECRRRLSDLKAVIGNSSSAPLPKLSELESFEFLISDGITREIQNEIISKCLSGGSLKLKSYTTATFSKYVYYFNVSLHNLKEITVIDHHDKSYYKLERLLRNSTPGDYMAIMNIPNSNLEKISLKNGENDLELLKVLRLLTHFPAVFCLDLEGNVILPASPTGELKNLSVQTLKIRHNFYGSFMNNPLFWNGWEIFYIRLLSFFPNLRRLHIMERLPAKGEWNGGVSMQLNFPLSHGTGQMYESKVWSDSPALDVIELELIGRESKKVFKIWSRNGYNNFLEQNKE